MTGITPARVVTTLEAAGRISPVRRVREGVQ
jgi:hypothetical protein